MPKKTRPGCIEIECLNWSNHAHREKKGQEKAEKRKGEHKYGRIYQKKTKAK